MRRVRWLITLLVLGFVVYAVLTSYRNWIVTERPPVALIPRNAVRVQVINASGSQGAARDVADSLSRAGFDVYDSKDYFEILPRTRVIDRRDPQMKYARELSYFMMIPAQRLGPFRIRARKTPPISSEIDSLLFLEATVVLGRDFADFLPVRRRPF